MSFSLLCENVFQCSTILGEGALKVHLCHFKKPPPKQGVCFSVCKLCWIYLKFCCKFVICLKSISFLHLFPPGPVYYCYRPYRTNLHHGWLSVPVSNFHVYYLAIWLYVFSLVSPLLVPCLHEGPKTTKDGKKWDQQRSVKQTLVSQPKKSVYVKVETCTTWQDI